MSQFMLEKFGEILIQKVRDEAINDWEKILNGRMKGSRAAEIRNLLSLYSIEQVKVLKELIPEVVDTTLHHLLWTIEQLDTLKIFLSDKDGTTCDIKEVSDGLPGELYGDRGWIKRFSNKRSE
jgi:predicted PhzF superfamily epimerase YddE/YHI9